MTFLDKERNSPTHIVLRFFFVCVFFCVSSRVLRVSQCCCCCCCWCRDFAKCATVERERGLCVCVCVYKIESHFVSS